LNLKKIPGFKEGRWLVMPEGSPFRFSWWFRTEFELSRIFVSNIWVRFCRISNALMHAGSSVINSFWRAKPKG
jgi:hypothetical protein